MPKHLFDGESEASGDAKAMGQGQGQWSGVAPAGGVEQKVDEGGGGYSGGNGRLQ